MKKFIEWINLQRNKNPRRFILVLLILFNITFIFISAIFIKWLSLKGTENMGFWAAVYHTVTMILDAGCISDVISDVGIANVALTIICLIIIVTGMISLTGSAIGYATNAISNFIDNASSGKKRLRIRNHTVILNWNNRASEIVNDLLYCPTKEKVVVLVKSGKDEIVKEIDERLTDTVIRENNDLRKECKDKGFFARLIHCRKNRFKKTVTVLVREGDVFSSKQLRDISLETAKSVIILGSDINNTYCKYEMADRAEERAKGNSQTVKTLMQVADITSAEYSNDDQKIIVEITDDWTWDLVDKIIKYKVNNKSKEDKCNILPIRVNTMLGQILSQFSLMPELNMVYRELFSNKGLTFYSQKVEKGKNGDEFVSEYIQNHRHAIPLTTMDSKDNTYAFFSAANEKDIDKKDTVTDTGYTLQYNAEGYWIEHKTVIILGHNSNCREIMQGFKSFTNEWNNGDDENQNDILSIIVIDDQNNLDKMNHYEDYPFVKETVPATIFDRDKICATIERIVASNTEDTSILILSDDKAPNEDIDANALANLVYVQDIINAKVEKAKAEGTVFDVESIDVIVEIIDPKHHDIVKSYSVNNVVISNRYISKMITQMGEKDAIFDFYTDILSYDEEGVEQYESKEIYAKKVSALFKTLPGECTAAELIRAVYKSSTDTSLPDKKRNPTVVLGYVKPGIEKTDENGDRYFEGGEMILFGGDQADPDRKIKLGARDKLIVLSNH